MRQWKRGRCRSCGVRYPQIDGVCVTCARRIGIPVPTVKEQEAAHLLSRRSMVKDRVPKEDLQPRPPKTIVAHHEEFEVIWDGT